VVGDLDVVVEPVKLCRVLGHHWHHWCVRQVHDQRSPGRRNRKARVAINHHQSRAQRSGPCATRQSCTSCSPLHPILCRLCLDHPGRVETPTPASKRGGCSAAGWVATCPRHSRYPPVGGIQAGAFLADWMSPKATMHGRWQGELVSGQAQIQLPTFGLLGLEGSVTPPARLAHLRSVRVAACPRTARSSLCPSLLAQVVILAVIPPGLTAANQTTRNGMPTQPELPRAYWSGLSGRLAVIS
jgi:hypothetical protein